MSVNAIDFALFMTGKFVNPEALPEKEVAVKIPDGELTFVPECVPAVTTPLEKFASPLIVKVAPDGTVAP